MTDYEPDHEPDYDASPESRASDPAPWSFARKWSFRFAFLYFLVYVHFRGYAPFPLDVLPNPAVVVAAVGWELPPEEEPESAEQAAPADGTADADDEGTEDDAGADDPDYAPAWVASVVRGTQPFFEWIGEYGQDVRTVHYATVDWTAEHVFGIAGPLDRPYGSGDPTHSWVWLADCVAFALVVATVWSLIDRRRTRHAWLAPWAHLAGRYWLAIAMLGYGLAKVIPQQFAFPSLSRLVTEYGHSSPMNVLWSFMGSSPLYVVFSGAGEVLAAVLLCFRRTATLGALVAVAVMSNVLVLNLAYDTPVKLYSAHLLAVALLLCVPDLARLARVFVLNRTTAPRDLTRPRVPYFGHAVKALVVGTVIFTSVAFGLRNHEARGQRPELFGIWDVTGYTLDGEEVPPLTTDVARWQNLVVDGASHGALRRMDGTLVRCGLAFDEEEQALTVSTSSTWTWERDGDGLRLLGEFDRTFREDPRDFRSPGTPVDPQVEVVMTREGEPALPDTVALEAAFRDAVEGDEPVSDAAEVDEASEAGEEQTEPTLPAELSGTWRVAERSIVGELIAGRRSDPTRWATLAFESPTTARVEFESGRSDVYSVAIDPEERRLRFFTRATLSVQRPTPDAMVLSGELRGHALELQLVRRSAEHYLLVRRGFHWINEVPLNRY